MSEVLISAVIPIYNGAEYIAETIESVLAQTRPADEVFLVDDGSTDNLDEVIQPYLKDIIFIRQQNLGVSAARNRAIRAAKGDWIALLDHDDAWLPHKLKQQLMVAEGREEVALIYSDMEVFGDEYKPSRFGDVYTPRGHIFKDMLMTNPVSPSASLMRRAAILEAGGFDESMWSASDLDMVLKLSARWEVEYMPEILARYRMHSGNLSKQRMLNLSNMYEILKNARDYNPEEYDEMWPRLRPILGEISFEIGRLYLETGDTHNAKLWFRKCLNYPGQRARALTYLNAANLPQGAQDQLRNLKRRITSVR